MGEAILTARTGGGLTLEEVISLLANYYTKDESLSDNTRELLGFGSGQILDDAISSLYQSTQYLSTMITGKIAICKRTWTGTGTYGSGNPMKVEVPGEPLAMFISTIGASTRYLAGYFIKGMSDYELGMSSYGGVPTFNDDSIEWYYTSNANYQFNSANTEYMALVIYQSKVFNGMITLTAKTENGLPIPNALIDGLYTGTGGAVYTNNNGVAYGFASSGDTCKIHSTYMDIDDTSFTIPEIPSGGLELEQICAKCSSGTIKFFDKSGTYYMSEERDVQISLIGGGNGGNGGNAPSSFNSSASGGSGGNGGKIANISVTLAYGKHTLVIGAGGLGGEGGSQSPYKSGAAGSTGGDTLLDDYSSSTGSITASVFDDSSYNIGGKGGSGGTGYTSSSDGNSSGSNGTKAGGRGGEGQHALMGGDPQMGDKGGYGGGGGGGGGAASYKSSSGSFYGVAADGGPGGPGYFAIKLL